MKKDKVVRVLIPYSLSSYYVDNGQQKGFVVDYMRELETFLNEGISKEMEKVRIVLIPTRRDQLLPGLIEGHGDLVVAGLTITPERLIEVDFSNPVVRGVREVLVSKKGATTITDSSGLSAMDVHVRKSSSYYQSLLRINEALKDGGLEPANIKQANENYEDEDLLEMVQTGILPATVIDEHAVKPWLSVFDKLQVHTGFALREGGELGWAFRKNSPEFKEVINLFVAKNKAGSLFGNTILKRYYSNKNRILNPKTENYHKKLLELVDLFNKYGEKYDIDPMLLAAQAFQESRFNNEAISPAGAVGIMQVLPSTASDWSVNIKNVEVLENNIEAGAKYMRFIADQYFDDDNISDLNKMLFVFASYNAGPNRVARVRKKADNPNKWFDSVDWQVARAAGTEPIKYVKNIYIYYVAFKKLEAETE